METPAGAQPAAAIREAWLDLCCGTGDLALELARSVRPAGRVVGLDAAAAPLELARQRQRRQPWLSVDWLQGDALQTGLADASADGVVMAYGLRNLADPAAGLAEIHRLLKPGGRAGVLDFNRCLPSSPQPLSALLSASSGGTLPQRPLACAMNTPTSKKASNAFPMVETRSSWLGWPASRWPVIALSLPVRWGFCWCRSDALMANL